MGTNETTKRNRAYKNAVKTLDRTVFDIIEKRRTDPMKHEDMLGILMDARDDVDGVGMSDKQLHDEVITTFLAGHETTANALSWTLYLLSQHPEVEAKLLQEIDTVIGSRLPVPEDYIKLTYTQNILWESMRLYPPGFLTGRKVDEEVEIGGYHFKKGDIVLVSQYVMHRKPEYFHDPHSFFHELISKEK